MLIQQTHFPQSGPNWGKILFITVGSIIIAAIVYNALKPLKVKIDPKQKPNDKTE